MKRVGIALILGVSLVVLAGCGERQRAMGGNGSIELADPATLDQSDVAADYSVMQTEQEITLNKLSDLEVVTSEARNFISRALDHEDISVQMLAMPVIQRGMDLDPQYANEAKEVIRRQIDVSLPEDREVWTTFMGQVFEDEGAVTADDAPVEPEQGQSAPEPSLPPQ